MHVVYLVSKEMLILGNKQAVADKYLSKLKLK